MDRKIVKAFNHVRMQDEDRADVVYWQSKSMAERLQEVVRLRKNYYTWLNGSFPEKMVKEITTRRNDL